MSALREGDDGSAVVEFVTLGVLLMVPLVYLILTMGRLQAASYAVDGAAREAGRAFATADSDDDGRARAVVAAGIALRDQGFDDVEIGRALTVDCSGSPCLTPGARVVTDASIDVVLPGVPGFLGDALPLSVTVRSSQTTVVDRFRAAS